MTEQKPVCNCGVHPFYQHIYTYHLESCPVYKEWLNQKKHLSHPPEDKAMHHPKETK